MSKYDVKAVVCDYGIFENDKLKIIVNSQANALLIKYVLEQDLQHKVVITDLLEKMSKKKRKFRAMTNSEYCRNHICALCPEYDKEQKRCYIATELRFAENAEYRTSFNMINREKNKDKPYKTRDGKYILREVKE